MKYRPRSLPAVVWLFWAAGASVLLLMLLSLAYCLAFLPALLSAGEPGFQWDYNARTREMVVTAVAPGSKAAAAGLRAGMRVQAIQDREPSPILDLWGPPGHRVLRPGDPLILVVSHQRGDQRLQWTLERRPWYQVDFAAGGWRLGADQLFHLCFLIAGLATLALGAAVLARKPHLPAARAFAGFCWALAMANHTAVVAHAPAETVPRWLLHAVFANDGWSRLALAAAIFFFMLFPEPKRFYRRHAGWVSALLFGPAALLLVVHGALAHSVWRFQPLTGLPGREAAIRALETWDWWGYTAPGAVVLISMLLLSYLQAATEAARRQMRSLALAAVPLLLFALGTTTLLLVSGSVPVQLALLAPLLFLALPFALGYSILTQGIFDLGRAVRGGLAYAGAMSLVMGAAFGIAGLVGGTAAKRWSWVVQNSGRPPPAGCWLRRRSWPIPCSAASSGGSTGTSAGTARPRSGSWRR